MAAEAGCDGAIVFELVEEAFDEVAHLVDLRAEGGFLGALVERADVGQQTVRIQFLPDGIAVIGAIAKQNAAITDIVYHRLECLTVVRLTGRQFQRDRQAVAVDKGMDFGRVPAAGTAHAIAEPPFLLPLAAC